MVTIRAVVVVVAVASPCPRLTITMTITAVVAVTVMTAAVSTGGTTTTAPRSIAPLTCQPMNKIRVGENDMTDSAGFDRKIEI